MASNSSNTPAARLASDPGNFVSTRASMRQIAKRFESAGEPSYQEFTAEAADDEMKAGVLPPKKPPKRLAKPRVTHASSQTKISAKKAAKSNPAKRKRDDGKSLTKTRTPPKRTKTGSITSKGDLPLTPESAAKTNALATNTPSDGQSAPVIQLPTLETPTIRLADSNARSPTVRDPAVDSGLHKGREYEVIEGGTQPLELTQQDEVVTSPLPPIVLRNQAMAMDDDSSSSLSSPPASSALEALREINTPPAPSDSMSLADADVSTPQSDEIAVSYGRFDETESSSWQETLIVKLSVPAGRIAMHTIQSDTESYAEIASHDHQVNTLGELVPATPMPETNDARTALQLPTPPSSLDSNTDRSAARPRPKRKAKAPERYGKLKEKMIVVETTESEASQNVEFGQDQVNEDGTTDQKEYTPTRAKSSTKRETPTSKGVKKVAETKVTKGRVTKPLLKKTDSVRKNKANNDSEAMIKMQSKLPLAFGKANSPPSAKMAQKSIKKYELVDALPLESDQSPWKQYVVDTAVRDILDKLTTRVPVPEKPSPTGRPEVWAESRQALCETLPYFKRPQGGCYQNDGHVYGFLFDGLGHCREYMDEDVIICRAGGSMESDLSGGMSQGKNQTFKEAQVQAVLNDIKHQNPCVVICGNKNEAAPCKMPHQYCVLGWYKPVLVWSEKTQGKGKKTFTTVKYRLERLNRHNPAWHSPDEKNRSDGVERAAVGPLREQTCSSCKKVYPQVYLRGWLCLNAECKDFWKFEGVEVPSGKEYLEYNPAFLLHQFSSWKSEHVAEEPQPSELRPPVPHVGNVIGDNLTYINTRGICCPKCGRCNSRRFFKGWVCENPTCDSRKDPTLFPQHRPIPLAILHTPWDAAPTLIRNAAPTLEHGDDQPGVNLKVTYKHGYKIATYTFDGIYGCFVHAAATKEVIQEEEIGPDAMFAALQTEDMGLERRTFASKKTSTGQTEQDTSKKKFQPAVLALPTPPEEPEVSMTTTIDKADGLEELPPTAKYEFEDGDLMTAFSMNYGMPYKFVASGASRSFEGAPWPIIQARRVLNWAQMVFLEKDVYEDFNEELVFAYLQGQKIEYHDDGEQGLGPRIATLSLGGRAKMHMRLKQKHYVGCSKTGIFTEERPIPGGIGGTDMDARRLEKWAELQTLNNDGDAATYRQRRKEIPKEIGLLEKRMKKADDLVTVTLSHGDIVLMEGYDIQKYLEHKVVPEGYFRFALTCRTVLESHLREDERPAYEVTVDPVKYLGPKLGAREAEDSHGVDHE